MPFYLLFSPLTLLSFWLGSPASLTVSSLGRQTKSLWVGNLSTFNLVESFLPCLLCYSGKEILGLPFLCHLKNLFLGKKIVFFLILLHAFRYSWFLCPEGEKNIAVATGWFRFPTVLQLRKHHWCLYEKIFSYATEEVSFIQSTFSILVFIWGRWALL